MKFSVLILTLNEERNIRDCLKSVDFCDDVVVFDSFSSDATVEIAKLSGARVVQREFDNYAAQRNASLNNVKYKYEWVLILDADERVPIELHSEIRSNLDIVDSQTTLFRMRRQDMFLGKWLKKSSGYPTWFGRLLKIGYVHVEREINEEFVTSGKVKFLNSHLIHYPFNKGVSYWIERHNRYSTMEAIKLSKELRYRLDWKNLFNKDPVLRRKVLKQVLYRLPFRPMIVFLYLYFFRLGFCDGKAGFIFCCLRSFYEYMITVKIIELKRQKELLPF